MSASDGVQLDRIDYDELELDDQLASRDGAPFSGLVYSLNNEGGIEFEGRYTQGLPDGLQEEWYPDGTIARRWVAVRGRGPSELWSWYPDGSRQSYRRYVDQRPVEIQDWDEPGHSQGPAT